MERKFRLFRVFRVHVNINHRYSGSHRCQSRAQATKSDKSDKSVSLVTSASEHIPLIRVICVQINNHKYSGSHRCKSRAQATQSDTSDTSVSLITSASKPILLICAIISIAVLTLHLLFCCKIKHKIRINQFSEQKKAEDACIIPYSFSEFKRKTNGIFGGMREIV